MTLAALAAVAGVAAAATATGCVVSDDTYRVDAAAQLIPLDGAATPIAGRLELLAGAAAGSDDDFGRTIAAYRVALPDGASPWVRLYRAASCAEPGDPPTLYEDLGTIRRVGDEAHFFATDVRIGPRVVDVDLLTTTASVTLGSSLFSVFDMIAVVQAPGDASGGTIIETSTDEMVPAGGPWLACGGFARL